MVADSGDLYEIYPGTNVRDLWIKGSAVEFHLINYMRTTIYSTTAKTHNEIKIAASIKEIDTL